MHVQIFTLVCKLTYKVLVFLIPWIELFKKLFKDWYFENSKTDILKM